MEYYSVHSEDPSIPVIVPKERVLNEASLSG